ncbi:cytochrome B [Mucilaginibacter sp. HMF5004]|uniref:cytochrome B n=1 Tax=Mucilaginibacter rivuli TaxID=2857527 RepID=UPI001C5F8CB8|nr:cytochrome B [Mucilaginibacter rivuli]MBW4891749.1 cytochrome B [Mucilaginibacter rivuli]
MDFYGLVKMLHSGFRYVVLVMVLVAILQALYGWLGKKPYTDGNRKVNLFSMIAFHTQILFGLILYFLSPLVKFAKETMKDPDLRYWTVEHISMMIFAMILVTVGHSRSKKILVPEGKHRAVAIFYGLALIVVIAAIVQSHRPLIGS